MFSLSDFLKKFLGGLPYPIFGGILRGIRSGIGYVLGGVVASVADGSLLNLVHIIPSEYVPFATGILGTFFLGIDKWLRERGLLEEAKETGLVPPDAKEIPLDLKPEVIEEGEELEATVEVEDSAPLLVEDTPDGGVPEDKI